jgi:hypothetical protein
VEERGSEITIMEPEYTTGTVVSKSKVSDITSTKPAWLCSLPKSINRSMPITSGGRTVSVVVFEKGTIPVVGSASRSRSINPNRLFEVMAEGAATGIPNMIVKVVVPPARMAL